MDRNRHVRRWFGISVMGLGVWLSLYTRRVNVSLDWEIPCCFS